MLDVMILFFVVGALLGGVVLLYVLKDKARPKLLVLLHGTVVAVGIALLATFAFYHHNSEYLLFLLVFAAIAVVGFYMFIKDFSGAAVSKKVALLHGILAILALAFLVYYSFA